MTSTLLIRRSSATAITPGVTTLAFGELVETNIGGAVRVYIGNSANVAFELSGAAYALLNSPAFTGTPTAPTASSGDNTNNVATTAFVTNAVQLATSGLVNKGEVVAATTSDLPSYTYNNGTAGVGATITANANGAIGTIDGVNLSVGNIFLYKNGTGGNAPYNGAYTVTSLGSGSTPFVLTRTTNFNSSVTIQPNSIFTVIDGGTVNGNTMWWVNNLTSAPTVGTTAIVFGQFAAGITYTGTSGVTVSGTVISAVVDNSTIAINGSNQIIVKSAGITQTQIASSALSGTGGLTGGSGSVLAIKPDSTTGATVAPISLSANGAGVTVDNSSILQTTGTLSVGTVDGGTF